MSFSFWYWAQSLSWPAYALTGLWHTFRSQRKNFHLSRNKARPQMIEQETESRLWNLQAPATRDLTLENFPSAFCVHKNGTFRGSLSFLCVFSFFSNKFAPVVWAYSAYCLAEFYSYSWFDFFNTFIEPHKRRGVWAIHTDIMQSLTVEFLSGNGKESVFLL